MTAAPKTREELKQALMDECDLVAEDVLEAIEALGLAIVPQEPTEAMATAGAFYAWVTDTLEEGKRSAAASVRAAIAAGNLAKGETNHDHGS